MSNRLADLPPDMLDQIAGRLDYRTAARFAMTSRAGRAAVGNKVAAHKRVRDDWAALFYGALSIASMTPTQLRAVRRTRGAKLGGLTVKTINNGHITLKSSRTVQGKTYTIEAEAYIQTRVGMMVRVLNQRTWQGRSEGPRREIVRIVVNGTTGAITLDASPLAEDELAVKGARAAIRGRQ